MSTVSYTGSTEHTFARGGGNTSPNQRNFFFIVNTSTTDPISVSFDGDAASGIPIDAGGHYASADDVNAEIKVYATAGATFIVHSDLHSHTSI